MIEKTTIPAGHGKAFILNKSHKLYLLLIHMEHKLLIVGLLIKRIQMNTCQWKLAGSGLKD